MKKTTFSDLSTDLKVLIVYGWISLMISLILFIVEFVWAYLSY